MADASKYMTSAKALKAKQEELNRLQTVEAVKVAEMLKEARSYGDLSENSEYDEAKNEQGKLYSKIAELQDFIEHAIITEDTEDTSKVGTGSTVTVLDLDSNIEEKYKIVTTQESDPMNGCISDESPIGGGLFGHEAGDTVAIETPAGVINYRILSIEK